MKTISIEFEDKEYTASISVYTPMKYKQLFKRCYFDDLKTIYETFESSDMVEQPESDDVLQNFFDDYKKYETILFAILYTAIEDCDEDFNTFFISRYAEMKRHHYTKLIELINLSMRY